MDFGANKIPVEVSVFGGTYFKDIYSLVNETWCRK